MTHVVLAARYDDPHIRLIEVALTQLGIGCTTLPLGLDAAEYDIEVDAGRTRVRCRSSDIDTKMIRDSALICLPFAVNRPPIVQAADAFGAREWKACFDSIFRIWGRESGGGWLIEPNALELQDSKLFLLHLLERRGIRVPEWAVSNHLGLPDSGAIVGKPINAWEEVSPGQYFTTTVISDELRDEVAHVRLATPAYVQEHVGHDAEARVYVAAGRATAVMFELRVGEAAPIDFRLGDAQTMSCRLLTDPAAELPIAELIGFTAELGLRYCVFDVVLRGDEQMVVDVNPAGSWAYLEDVFGIDISRPLLGDLLQARS